MAWGRAGTAPRLTTNGRGGAARIKPGAAIVDIGFSHSVAGIFGNLDFVSAAEIAGWITSTTRGTGPMSVACLLENTVCAASIQGVRE
jgi:methylenetetrahydrofolate dehydrogenase (NADP+)/methenyltetrahydrofolate cyclohydrolase